MAKKKQEGKPQRYIAVNGPYDEIIHIGSLDQIKEAIEEYCFDHDVDESDVDDLIKIYELGEEVSFGTERRVQIYF
jgi:hypothetical protein